MSQLPITVEHAIAAPRLEVIPAAMVERIETVLALSQGITVSDPLTLEVANKVVVQLHQLGKDIDQQAEVLKKPLNQTLKAVRECVERAASPVAEAKRSVQAKLGAYQRQQEQLERERQAAAEAERRKAAAEAEEKRRVLQAEADAKAAAAAKELEDLLGTPVEPEKVVVATPALTPKPNWPHAEPAAPVQSAVTTRMVDKVVIFDPRALAAAYEVGGRVIVKMFDMAAIGELVRAGVAVPGVQVERAEQVVMRRGA